MATRKKALPRKSPTVSKVTTRLKMKASPAPPRDPLLVTVVEQLAKHEGMLKELAAFASDSFRTSATASSAMSAAMVGALSERSGGACAAARTTAPTIKPAATACFGAVGETNGDIAKALDELHEAIARLGARLTPVLSAGEEVKLLEQPHGGSGLHTTLLGNLTSIRNAAIRVDTIYGALTI